MSYFTLYSRDTSSVKDLHSYEVAVQLGDHPINQHGERLLGATCVTDDEVDHRINGLIKNLEEIRVAAKKKLEANQA